MTAVMAEALKPGEINLEALRACVEDLQSKVEKVSSSLADSRLRLQDLTAERSTLILPARSGKNTSAQKRLYAIDEQLSALNRDISDDQAALSELEAQLDAAQIDLERTEWESQRSSVRALLEERLNGKTGAAIQKAVDALVAALQSAAEKDEQAKAALLAFEPSLGRDLRPLSMAVFGRSRLAAWKLQRVLPVDSREFGHSRALDGKEFAEEDRNQYCRVIEALDGLKLVFRDRR